MNINVAFVILHYLVIEETIACIESIQKNIDTDQYKIVVVDNASPNYTGEKLKKRFQGNDKITVIINRENIGFAKGNNAGIDYVKKRWYAKYIILLNNDILMLETKLFDKLEKEFIESQFSVLGPLILTKDGRYDSNPVRNDLPSIEEIILREKKIKLHYFFTQIFLFTLLKQIKELGEKILRKEYISKNSHLRQENIMLHGCFLVLTEKYFEKFSGLDNRTFLYLEEDILLAYIRKEKLKNVYLPDILIYHKEDAATDAISNKKSNKKYKFTFKHHLNSLQVLKSILSELK